MCATEFFVNSKPVNYNNNQPYETDNVD